MQEKFETYCGGESCAAEAVRAVELLASAWSVPLLEALALCFAAKPVRFRELQRAVAGISQKELAKRLDVFVRHGIVRRQVEDTRPPSVRYSLAEDGFSLMAEVERLGVWARKTAGGVSAGAPVAAPQEEGGRERATWLSVLSLKEER